MLQAEYNNNTYTFYVTLQDVMYFTITDSYSYLFKFTNDLSGDVKWAYGQNAIIKDRYCQFDIYSTKSGTITEDVFGGVVDFQDNGYWKYEIYITDGASTPCGNPNPTEFGTWECTNLAGTSIDSGSMDVDVYEIDDLPADTYQIDEYSTCEPPPTGSPSGYILTQVISNKSCEVSGQRDLLFTRVVRNVDTNTFYINSTADVGSDIVIYNSHRTYTHKITANPESVEINIECNPKYQIYTVELRNLKFLVDTYNDITPLSSNTTPESETILASNNYYQDLEGCNNQQVNGSIFFAWRGQGNTVVSDYVTPTPLEVGKLLVNEQVGEEQVQYKEHSTVKGTNYIYNE